MIDKVGPHCEPNPADPAMGAAASRLKSDVTLEQAREEFSGITSRLERQYPSTNRDQRIVPLKDRVVGEIRPALLTLLCAVVFGC